MKEEKRENQRKAWRRNYESQENWKQIKEEN